VNVADYRIGDRPEAHLQALWDAAAMQLWSEGIEIPGFPAEGRSGLAAGSDLVVWTAPAGPRIWNRALRAVQPNQVYLFAVDPVLDAFQPFIRRLTGLVRHALTAYGGQLLLGDLAEAMAHREGTVQTGVQWLASRGQLTLVEYSSEKLVVASGGAKSREAEQTTRRKLESLLQETAAYRSYFRQADAKQLVAEQEMSQGDAHD
jgi:single-stranded-DNA-specific exonuclease